MKIPPPFIVLISADFEWNAVVDLIRPAETRSTPFGAAFFSQLGKHTLLMAHSGWGKTATAAACQHLIDLHQPQLILNLGTCGGLEGRAEVGEVLLPEETAMYDIVEGMSAYSEALAYYHTRADLGWLPAKLPPGMRRTRIVSADQDIQPCNVVLIANYFHAPAADWESAAFAWTAAKNKTPWLILRGVSDLVSSERSEAYQNAALWQQRAAQIMARLLALLPWFLDRFPAVPDSD